MSSDILIGKLRIPIYQTQKPAFCFEFDVRSFFENCIFPNYRKLEFRVLLDYIKYKKNIYGTDKCF